jgi:hypothetical protein
MNPKLFPTILIVMNICAAAGYMFAGDYRMVAYWTAAAVLNAAVTY